MHLLRSEKHPFILHGFWERQKSARSRPALPKPRAKSSSSFVHKHTRNTFAQADDVMFVEGFERRVFALFSLSDCAVSIG